MKYVALLRGINVGKSVQVPMGKLKSLFEEIGLSKCVTYLNSGNVVFESDTDRADVAVLIEQKLEREYGRPIPTLVKTAEEMIRIKNAIPEAWKNDETQQTYVAYLFSDIARSGLIDELPIKRNFMEIIYAHEALIWNIQRANYNKSRITNIVAHPSYGRMTTRNVNTARKLAEMCGG